MNPFTQMASVLSAVNLPAWNTEAIPDGLNRTDRIRQLLKEASRPVTANEIAWDMADHFPNFGSHLVWLLMKYDMQKGRVILEDGKYRWNVDYDTAEAKSIRDAVQLLRKHGYRVTGGNK